MTNIDDQEYDGYYFLSITQPSKMTLVRYEKVDLNELKAKRDKERSKPQQEQKPVAPFTVSICSPRNRLPSAPIIDCLDDIQTWDLDLEFSCKI